MMSYKDALADQQRLIEFRQRHYYISAPVEEEEETPQAGGLMDTGVDGPSFEINNTGR